MLYRYTRNIAYYRSSLRLNKYIMSSSSNLSTLSSTSSSTTNSCSLETLVFDNRSLYELPIDPIEKNYVRQVKNAIFSRVKPQPVTNPELVSYSSSALQLLNLDISTQITRSEFIEYFSGNKILPGAEPAAHCYCGHQFGSFSGQLGDGATMYLGEIINKLTNKRYELQFKGAGLTPYSRTADGRKVLRSSIREFLASEAHHALGIPTTRAGTIVTSDTPVIRDVYYTGNPIEEKATIITRIAETFLRFGSFEIVKDTDPETGRTGPSAGNIALLKQLMDFTSRHYYPEIYAQYSGTTEQIESQRYYAMYREICLRTARLFALWQTYGWCHGVLNTDNMSIVGVTIDYGPYGWMERFDPEYICNTSDNTGRYSYENQPQIGQWNCRKLGEIWSPLLKDHDYRNALKEYGIEFRRVYNELCKNKLGLGYTTLSSKYSEHLFSSGSTNPSSSSSTSSSSVVLPSIVIQTNIVPTDSNYDNTGGLTNEDEELYQDLLDIMNATGADFTNTFRALMSVDILGSELNYTRPPKSDNTMMDTSESCSSTSESTVPEKGQDPVLDYIMDQCATAKEIADAKKPRIPWSRLQTFMAMAQSNPVFADQIHEIEQEMEKYRIYNILANRTDAEKDQQDRSIWSMWLTKYRNRLQAELPSHVRQHMLHHDPQSDRDPKIVAEYHKFAANRMALMEHSNPKYILRNWIAHVAIKAAEQGDYSIVQQVQKRLEDPFGFTDNSMEDEFTAAFAASHMEAPNTADSGATRQSGKYEGPQKTDKDTTTCNINNRRTACRPPPWALDLKVT